MFYKCPGLTNAPALPATELTNDCYRAMFHGCSGLTTPPELPATNLAESCYQNMFAGCTGLTNAPALPAANLLYSCYFSMFRECTGLTEAPELPATTLAAQCYAEMFAACTGLTNAPALPAANLADNCYSYMFRGCTGLTRLPELSAINLAPYCYAGMFDSCTGIMLSEDGTGPTWSIPEDATPAAGWNTNMLVETGGAFTGDPVIGATYYYTAPPPSFSNAHLTFTSDEAFSITPQAQSWQGTLEYSTDAANWAAFTTGGAAAATNASGKYLLYLRGTSNTCMTGYARPGWLLNATGPVACSGNIETLLDYTTVAAGQHPAMADFCFAGLFMDWTNLTEAPDLPATNLTPSCYRATFSGCGNLTTAPELPATTLASHCYYFMFFACPGLTNAPALPATDLADNCYENMFRSCTGLTKAPDLPATNLAVWCYGNMFNGCRALTQAPALPAATLPNSCYVGMFQDCRALTNAPALPATNLLFQCYANMFRGCTSLTEAPDLPAMNLAGSCYKSMFHGCTGLTRVPELPATNLLRSCYEAMFKNCTGITLYKDGSGPPWGIPAGAQAQEDWNLDMFAGTSGLFTGNPAIGVTYYHAPPLASEAHLTFTSDDAFSIAPKMNSWNGTLECSTDAATWALFTTNGAAAATNASGEFKLYVRGTSNTIITGSFETPGWRMDGADAIACSGNIETLLDYQTVAAGQHPLMADYCFANLFREWTNLTATPTLPATTLTEACYLYMFKNCASLTEAPELPASTLAYGCYYGMFESCAGLTQTPALSAMNLAEGCYGSMFEGCTALTNAPALPATTLTDWCYCCMFRNCTSLMDTPALPARTVMESSYNSMFHGCTRLRKLPELPATNLALNCYYSMFRSCTGIKLSATGPGTPWGIPANAKEQEDWNLEMFTDTGGPFTGRPGIGVTYYYDSTPPSPPPGGYIAFVSEGAFSITPREESWNGTLECSTDAVTWAPFTTNGATAAPNDARDYLLYLRGTSNTCVTGQNKPGWNINAPEEAFCFGNIENLLDYETVANGLHPAMDAWCFANLFNGCSDLAKAPELPAMTLSDSCYNGMFFYCTRLKRAPELPATNLSSYCYSSMFYGCMWLKEAPELPAMNLAEYCYAAMFSECLSLTNAPALPATTLANYGYGDMFTDCTGLTRLPELPATNLAEYCYQNMFAGCSGIALHANGTAPTWGIPADATEKTGWNTGMLAETGGTFTGDPAIGAIYHYSPLPAPGAYLTFSSTNPFTITPKFDSLEGALSASTDALNWVEFTTNGAAAADNGSGEYRLYICGWGNSRIPAGHYQPGWAIDAPTGTVACSGNIETLLDHEKVAAGKHPAMANWCFMDLFQMCTALASAPELPAETLSQGCYYGMFADCTGLTEAPALPAQTLAPGCYYGMFCACTGLTNAPALPATNLANFCYHQMFAECPNLTTAPALPATHLADYCYHAMFAECTGLTNAPELPATTMAECSYQHMFFRCTGLTSAPELPATNLAQQCYAGMFRGCTALTSPPALPATTMAFAAYVEMFRGCTALTNTPALPATNLMSFCYEYMFEGCTGLTRLPELPATDLAYHGYAEMFRNCTGIKLYENGTGPTWGIPAGATEKTGWNEDMLVGTGGAFTNDPVIGATYYYAPPPAPGACLTFSSANTFTITPWVQSWNGALHASTDGTNWVPFTTNGATAADNGSGEYRLYLCGWGNSHITGAEDAPGWTINAEMGTVACAGNIETLLDHTKVAAGEHPAMDDWCFANLFQNCAALTSPPDLPATNLAPACYHTIFYRCTALTNAPELPATTLAEDCYLGMFADCAALKNAPELPATNLAEYCYTGMFYGCKQLRNPPKLPATNLAQNCYEIMFADCMRLRNAPELPATTLTQACYQNMFWGCEGLTTLPKLPATNLAENCYSGMFRDCTSIKLNATGPGTPWGIPESAQAATNWNTEMLVGTSGAFTNDPVIGAIYYHQALPPPPAPGAHLTFSSPDAFTISPEKKGWDGTVQYSTDATNWSEFTIAGAEAATNSAGEFRLYICGTSNTCIAKWEEDLFGWELAANGPVACAGNIETLLDHPQVTAGEHPAMADSCFAALFHDWTALTSAPELPATNLTESCYRATFYGCTGLTEAPVLPATTMARDCYLGMFAGCAALTNAPGLPATDLAETCYEYMFQDCTALTNAPALPATTLANNCYRGMFRNCTALKKAPALPATNLTVYCYHIMFQGCTALTTPPELPATTLTNHCYAHMFRDCTALTKLPVLPATNLACCCYVGMFGDCINIRLNTEGPGTPWGIPESATAAPDWNNGMFTGTGGPFTDDPVIGVTYYLNSAPFFPADGSLVFDGTTLTIKITNAESGLWYTLYSLDNLLEETWTKIESLQATGSELTFTINLGTPAEPRLFFKVVATPEKP